MRDDVAERYKKLVDNPQKIIFSDLPPDERTETIPPRSTRGGYARVVDADEDEFILQGEDMAEPDFELNTGAAAGAATAPESAQTADTESAPASESPAAAKPAPETPSDDSAQKESAPEATAEQTEQQGRTEEAASPPPGEADADDLLSIAITQEKEAGERKRERRAAMNRKRILIPCPSCGVWLRVREEQSGRSVRCRSCQTPVSVPKIKKKEKKADSKKAPELVLDWIEDLHVHLVVPTDITLKPASLEDTYQTADAVFTEDGMHLVILGGPPKKKSLFSRGSDDTLPQLRTEIRDHVKKTGELKDLPGGELYSVPSDNLSSIRLVQPIRQAHESMFAGVPVFGVGRIVVYLPVNLEDGKQLYCSMPLTLWRQFATHLKQAEITLPAKENGVPQSEIHASPLCHYTQAKVESIRDLPYYQNDSAYELELTGYRCAACGTAVSESARAKNKLGGKAGKGIAKAKCPSCSAKFGNEPLYRISKAPESPEGEEDAAADASGS